MTMALLDVSTPARICQIIYTATNQPLDQSTSRGNCWEKLNNWFLIPSFAKIDDTLGYCMVSIPEEQVS